MPDPTKIATAHFGTLPVSLRQRLLSHIWELESDAQQASHSKPLFDVVEIVEVSITYRLRTMEPAGS